MMFVSRGAGDIVVEVLMTRQIHKGSILLVEGDDDSRFLRPRIATASCQIVIADGKPNVVGAIVRLDGRSFGGALGAIDDDFDSLEARSLPSPNLVFTDAHDVECLLLRSRALEKVLAEYGNDEKIEAFVKAGQTVRDALLQRGLAFGKLRWLAIRHGWPLDFQPLTPWRFVDQKTWAVDSAGLLAEAVRRGCPLSVAELQSGLAALPEADPWKICQGHDLVDILVIGLKGVLGQAQTLGRDQISSVLRQAVEAVDLNATTFFADIRVWERANPPYLVLAA